jgi:hypothetical protein
VIVKSEAIVEFVHPRAFCQHADDDGREAARTRGVFQRTDELRSDPVAAQSLGDGQLRDVEIATPRFRIVLDETRAEAAHRTVTRRDEQHAIVLAQDVEQAIDVPLSERLVGVA